MKKSVIIRLCMVFILMSTFVFAKDVVIAQVNNEKIKLKDFAALIQKSNLSKNEMLRNKEAYEKILNKFIDSLLVKQYVMQNNLISKEEIKDSLEVEVFKFMLQVWMQDETRKIQVTKQDVKKFYEANKDKIKTPSMLELSHIAYAQKNSYAIKILHDIKDSDNIEKAFAKHNGFPKWVKSSDLPSDVYKTLSSLKEGSMTKDYINIGDSFYLFYLKSKREGKLLTYEEAKASLKTPTRNYILNRNFEKLYKRLYKNARISYDKETELPIVNGFKWTIPLYEKYFLDSDKNDLEKGFIWRISVKSFKELPKDKKDALKQEMLKISLFTEYIKKTNFLETTLAKKTIPKIIVNLMLQKWKLNLKRSVIPTAFEKMKCINDDNVALSSKDNCIKNHVYNKYMKDIIYHLRKNSYIQLFLDKEYVKVAKVKKLTLNDDRKMIQKCLKVSTDITLDISSRFLAINAKCSNFLLKDVRKACKKFTRRNRHNKKKDDLNTFCSMYTTSYKAKY